MKVIVSTSLKNTNTFHIDACCEKLVLVESSDEIREGVLSEYYGQSQPRYLLGQGSNVLLLNDLDAPVIQLASSGWTFSDETEESIIVTVEGGQDWHEFVIAMCQQEYWGVENLALIPGSVGASPVQNIGAYGVELNDVFEHADVLDLDTGELIRFDKEMCEFSYRESFFKKNNPKSNHARYLIYRVCLRLLKKASPKLGYADLESKVLAKVDSLNLVTPLLIAERVMSIRQSKLPNWKVLGCAGSFFKNPVISESAYKELKEKFPGVPASANGHGYKVAAGWLIDQAGWKGYEESHNDAGVYHKQALVLVNHGNASGHDIKALAEKIMCSIETKYSIKLEQEVIDLQGVAKKTQTIEIAYCYNSNASALC